MKAVRGGVEKKEATILTIGKGFICKKCQTKPTGNGDGIRQKNVLKHVFVFNVSVIFFIVVAVVAFEMLVDVRIRNRTERNGTERNIH